MNLLSSANRVARGLSSSKSHMHLMDVQQLKATCKKIFAVVPATEGSENVAASTGPESQHSAMLLAFRRCADACQALEVLFEGASSKQLAQTTPAKSLASQVDSVLEAAETWRQQVQQCDALGWPIQDTHSRPFSRPLQFSLSPSAKEKPSFVADCVDAEDVACLLFSMSSSLWQQLKVAKLGSSNENNQDLLVCR